MSTPTSTDPRGADLLVQALQTAGVRVVFALSGNHIMAVFDALLGSGIRLVHTRHEAAAVHMADAWARLTGEVGVALVTGGPGHANAVAALYTAAMAEAPVLLLSGHAPLSQLGLGAFQEMRQADIAAPLCKAAWTNACARSLASDVARAVQLAHSGRPGPVHLSLPSDLLEARLPAPPAVPPAEAFKPLACPLPDNAAQDLLAWLQAGDCPLVLAGPAACTRSGRAACAALQTAAGVPVLAMDSPRGVADPGLGALAQVLAQADRVLLLGKRLDFTLKFGREPFGPAVQWAQVDADVAELERTAQAVGARLLQRAVADLPSALRAMTASASAPCADPRLAGRHTAWVAEVAGLVAWRPPAWASAAPCTPGRLHPVHALSPLQALLDSHPDAVFISDGGEIGQWAQAVLHAPQRLTNGVAGAIGSALPSAVAARCAVGPDVPVVAVMGDGTVGFHLAEFDTGVREGAPFVVVVGNDARWNAEFQIQLKDYGVARSVGCELAPTRYDLAAAGLGAHGEHVTQVDQLPAAIQRAANSGLPACINVMTEGLPAPQLKRPAA